VCGDKLINVFYETLMRRCWLHEEAMLVETVK
jgi:hypothetical protein